MDNFVYCSECHTVFFDVAAKTCHICREGTLLDITFIKNAAQQTAPVLESGLVVAPTALPIMTTAPVTTMTPKVTITPLPTMCVMAEEGLWVRTEPDAEAPLARPRALLNGECVMVYEIRNGWARIGLGEWVNADYLN